VFTDDCRVVKSSGEKLWGDPPRVYVEVERLTGDK
jgi:hypothetical protein